MGRAAKYLFRLAVLALIALVAYALIADLPPPTRQVEIELAVPAGTPRQEAEPEPASAPAASETAIEQEAGGAAQQ